MPIVVEVDLQGHIQGDVDRALILVGLPDKGVQERRKRPYRFTAMVGRADYVDGRAWVRPEGTRIEQVGGIAVDYRS